MPSSEPWCPQATFYALRATYGFLSPELWRETRFTKSPLQECAPSTHACTPLSWLRKLSELSGPCAGSPTSWPSQWWVTSSRWRRATRRRNGWVVGRAAQGRRACQLPAIPQASGGSGGREALQLPSD